MINLNQLAMLLDAASDCGNKNCDDCKAQYRTGNDCPLWTNKENTRQAFIAIEEYLDDVYDKTIFQEYNYHNEVMYQALSDVDQIEFLRIITGSGTEDEMR